MYHICPHAVKEVFYKIIDVNFEIRTSIYPHVQSLVDIAQILKIAPQGHIFAPMLPWRHFTDK